MYTNPRSPATGWTLSTLWTFLLLAIALLVAQSLLFRGRTPTARTRRHARYQARAQRVIATLRAIDPLANPKRAFGYLRSINPYVFEELILSLLERRDLRITRSGSYSGDGGVDGQFVLNGRRWLIQAKRYSRSISPGHLADFEAICAERGAQGLFVHSGRTGPTSMKS